MMFEAGARTGEPFCNFWLENLRKANFIKKQFSSPEKWGIIYIRPHF